MAEVGPEVPARRLSWEGLDKDGIFYVYIRIPISIGGELMPITVEAAKRIGVSRSTVPRWLALGSSIPGPGIRWFGYGIVGGPERTR
jgi:hypothetical protein